MKTKDKIATKLGHELWGQRNKLGVEQFIKRIKAAIEKALLKQKPGEATDLAYEAGRAESSSGASLAGEPLVDASTRAAHASEQP